MKNKVISVILFCSSFSTDAAELLVSPSRAKWERILNGINKSFGEGFLTRIEDFTGVQRTHDLARSTLKNDFGIDPIVVSYCQFLVESEKREDVPDLRATILIIETRSTKRLEEQFKQLPKTTLELRSIKPLIASIFKDERLIILVIFDGVRLGKDERKIVSLIEELRGTP